MHFSSISVNIRTGTYHRTSTASTPTPLTHKTQPSFCCPATSTSSPPSSSVSASHSVNQWLTIVNISIRNLTVPERLTYLPVPFVVTMVVSVLISSYMLFDPARWLYDLMQLTPMSPTFKIFIVFLALSGFLCANGAERVLFPHLARFIGRLNDGLRPKHRKKRKEYKVIEDSMRF